MSTTQIASTSPRSRRHENRLTVLLTGRSQSKIAALEAMLQGQKDIAITTRVVVNGHSDPMHGLDAMPEILILRLSELWEEELDSLARIPTAERPAMLVIGSEADARCMRLAMRAGAGDFLTEPFEESDLSAALGRLIRERTQENKRDSGELTAVINAKGGSGASFIACNLAHMMQVNGDERVALLDLDTQFGSLPYYLELSPRHGLADAVEAVDELDAVALEGYMTRHKSGLDVLSTVAGQPLIDREIDPERLERLLAATLDHYDRVVVDMPRRIDPLTAMVLESADTILVVVQQQLATLNDGARLLLLLQETLAVPEERIKVVVNRYSKNSEITGPDIEKALGCKTMEIVPNDFRNVAESVNSGTPIADLDARSPAGRALTRFEAQLSGRNLAVTEGRISTFVNGLLKR